jgi:hypothetical protein
MCVQSRRKRCIHAYFIGFEYIEFNDVEGLYATVERINMDMPRWE